MQVGNPRGRILIVDDEPSILTSYCQFLTKAGFDVAKVSKSQEALRRAKTQHFDLVFSNISMPEMDGLTLLRRIHQESPELPVVMMLDALDNRLLRDAAEAGALESLVKPIDAKLLAEVAAYGVRLNRTRRKPLDVRSDYRQAAEVNSVAATKAKNEFGRLLDEVNQKGVLFITKHDTAKAVLLSVNEYTALSRATEVKLDTLSGEFDAMLARMQTPKARAVMKALFAAPSQELGEAAVASVHTRG
jgi:antitoxin Phd